MQRSRRALLRRRAAAAVAAAQEGAAVSAGRRRRLYGVSVSLVVASWVVVLLVNSLVSHGDGRRDGEGAAVALAVVEPSMNEDSVSPGVQREPERILTLSYDTSDKCDEDMAVSEETLLVEDKLASEREARNDDAKALTKDVQAEISEVRGESVPQAGSDDEKAVTKDNQVELSEGLVECVPQADSNPGVDSGVKAKSEDTPRAARLSRVVPPGLDEFKTKAIAERGKGVSNQTGNVIHRVEPSGKLYNYASSSKGAKVLDFNKEAKGASNILDKDKDKYLRNPCSTDGKFVVIELSEETLVDTIAIANFEHYSSNLKEFELLSSLAYPTENWEKLGNFTAANAKLVQNFTLSEPKWARYLKINLLSHYGSEFYCTLSMLEVFGVDAVERMLEDLIPVENKRVEPDDQVVEQIPLKETASGKDSSQELIEGDEFELQDDKTKGDSSKNGIHDPIAETRVVQAGRIAGDTVLKLLMQKVQSLDVSFSVLERYIEELNSRYGQIFNDFDTEIENKDLLLEKIKLELKNLESSNNKFVQEIEEILSWKLVASLQLNQLLKDNAILRSEFENFRERQADLENRGLAVIFLSFIFGCLAIAKLFIGMVSIICRYRDSANSHRVRSGWLVLLLSSCIIASILVL